MTDDNQVEEGLVRYRKWLTTAVPSIIANDIAEGKGAGCAPFSLCRQAPGRADCRGASGSTEWLDPGEGRIARTRPTRCVAPY